MDTPKEYCMQNVVDLLLQHGFLADGYTPQEHVRIPTTRAPAFCNGKAGGELATFGGRARFIRNGLYCTVGKRTTCFYLKKNKKAYNFDNFDTKDFEAIESFVSKLA